MKSKSTLATINRDQAALRRPRLKLALKKAGVTAKAASLKAGLSETYIHDFLSGKSPSTAQTLQAICNANGISWEWLDSQILDFEPLLKHERLPSDPQVISLLLESVIGYFTPGLPQPKREHQASQLLAILLEIADDPGIQFYDLKNVESQRERLRNVIDFAVRATFRR